MTTKDYPHTLTDAQNILNKCLSKKRVFSLPTQQKAFLVHLSNRIDVLFTAANNWLKVGLLNDYERGMSTFPPTQTELLKEAKQVYKKRIGFTYLILKQMQQDIRAAFKAEKSSEYRKCLEKVNKYIKKTIDPIANYITFVDGEVVVRLDDHKDFYAIKRSTDISMIHALGGRYLPFMQSKDPLHGNSKGHCAGYVLVWAQVIEKRGKFLLTHALTQAVHHRQILQCRYRFFKAPLHYLKEMILTSGHIAAGESFCPIIEKIVDRINSNKIYEITMNYTKTQTGHALGIRRCYPQGIEFFDPNFGTMIFDDTDTFKKWMGFFLNRYSAEFSEGGSFELNIIADQSPYAEASIPPLTHHRLSSLHRLELNSMYLLSSNHSAILKDDYQASFENFSPAEKILFKQLNAFALTGFSTNPFIDQAAYHAEFKDRLLEKKEFLLSEENLLAENQHQKMRVNHCIKEKITQLMLDKQKNQESITKLKMLMCDINQAATTTSLKFVLKKWVQQNAPISKNILAFTKRLATQHEISIYRLTLLRELLLKQILRIAREKGELTIQTMIENKERDNSFQTIFSALKAAITPHTTSSLRGILKVVNLNDPEQLVALNQKLSINKASSAACFAGFFSCLKYFARKLYQAEEKILIKCRYN